MDDSSQSKSIRDFKLKSVNAYYRGLDACEKYRKRRRDDSRLGSDGETLSANDVRGERIDQRRRREDGWKQAEDLSWAYEASAAVDRETEAADEVRDVPLDSNSTIATVDATRSAGMNELADTIAMGVVGVHGGATGSEGGAGPIGCDLSPVSDDDVVTSGPGECGAAAMGSTARNKGNEAKFDENVITTQLPEPVDVMTNFGANAGLDNVAGLRCELDIGLCDSPLESSELGSVSEVTEPT